MVTATAAATSSASGGVLASPGATVQMSNVAKLGNILTDGAGMTLYVFKQDTPGTSNCTDACAQNWPPLTVDEAQEPVAGTGVTGKLDFIDRSDGTYQVPYDGVPLYRFVGDKQPGDTNGQGMLNGQWSVVSLTAAAPAAPAAATPMATEMPGAMSTSSPSSGGMLASPGAAVQVAADAKLGNILTDSAGMTLYIYAKDTPGASNCTGMCAQNWLPLPIAAGALPSAGTGVTGQLGVIPRSDGTYQVTYNGMPLYRFIRDKQPGDTNGQGMAKGQWSVLSLTAAAPAAPAAATPQSMATPAPQATSSY